MMNWSKYTNERRDGKNLKIHGRFIHFLGHRNAVNGLLLFGWRYGIDSMRLILYLGPLHYDGS